MNEDERERMVAALAEALWDADARASGWRLDEARYADTTDRARAEMTARAGTVLAALRHKGHTVVTLEGARHPEAGEPGLRAAISGMVGWPWEEWDVPPGVLLDVGRLREILAASPGARHDVPGGER